MNDSQTVTHKKQTGTQEADYTQHRNIICDVNGITPDLHTPERSSMSAFNAFFAQLTGGGNSNTSPGSERDSRGGGGAGGAGVVGGGAGGGDGGSSGRRGSGSGSVGGGNRDRGGGGSSSASDVFGVPLKGTVVTYRPETDRRHFGIPQVCVCV